MEIFNDNDNGKKDDLNNCKKRKLSKRVSFKDNVIDGSHRKSCWNSNDLKCLKWSNLQCIICKKITCPNCLNTKTLESICILCHANQRKIGDNNNNSSMIPMDLLNKVQLSTSDLVDILGDLEEKDESNQSNQSNQQDSDINSNEAETDDNIELGDWDNQEDDELNFTAQDDDENDFTTNI